MNSAQLQKLAQHMRFMREAGYALLIASALLTVFLFIPFGKRAVPIEPIATEIVPDAFITIPLEAKAAIVYDLATNEVLFAKNAEAQLPLASLIKLLTIYAALAQLSPNTPVTIPASAIHLDGPHAFSIGQTFSLADLARLTLTASLNDGAVAIIEAVATRENRRANETIAGAAATLGLAQTYAVNGSGLDMSATVSGGYGSARDLAILSGALVREAPTIARATTFEFAEAVSVEGTVFKVKNTDPIVATIPRLLLSKTGYTDLAGGNLALVFDSGIQHPIAIVVLGSSQTSRFTDGMALVEATLAHFAGLSSL